MLEIIFSPNSEISSIKKSSTSLLKRLIQELTVGAMEVNIKEIQANLATWKKITDGNPFTGQEAKIRRTRKSLKRLDVL